MDSRRVGAIGFVCSASRSGGRLPGVLVRKFVDRIAQEQLPFPYLPSLLTKGINMCYYVAKWGLLIDSDSRRVKGMGRNDLSGY